MELISKDRQNITIKFTTDEIVAIRLILTGLVQEYRHVDADIIGVSEEYVKTLESNLYALQGEAISG